MPTSGNSPMQAGMLRRKLVILPGPSGTGAFGEPLESTTGVATPLLTTWGAVQSKPQNTLIAAIAGVAMAQSQYLITLRYPPSVSISPGMRVQDGARVYRIHQVADIDERHRTLQLLCMEEPAN